MADTKITALSALTAADPANDVLPIVDVNDPFMAASGTTKKISINNILGASGTATLASATITGALTVDTTTLVVNPAGYPDRVGIGTASPALPLEIYKASGDSKMRITSGANSLTIGWDDPNGFYYTANTSLMAWQLSGSTAMTLNATGLGVGVASASYNLDVRGSSSPTIQVRNTTSGIGNFAQLRLDVNNSFSGSGTAYLRAISGNSGNSNVDLAFGVNALGGGAPFEAMRIDSSGNVGIGVTPSAWGSNYTAVELTKGASIFGAKNVPYTIVGANVYNDATNEKYAVSPNTAATKYQQTGGVHSWYTAASGTAGTAITDFATAKMTLDASGNLLVGTTTTSGNAGGLKLSNVGGTLGQITFSNNSGVADYVARFNYGSTPTLVGTITVASGGTTYNTTSDYRLKESVQPLVGGLARVSALKPSIYKWKSDGSSGEGFLAHELAEVVPFAVTGEKDAVNEDGSVKAQGVDLSRVVPILVAAIQELAAEVNALKNA